MPRTFPPSVRRIDPRYMRVGAGLSAAILALAVVTGWWPLAAVDAVLLAGSAFLGSRFWLLSRPWARLRTRLNAPPARIVPDIPYRFSQAGAVVLLAVAGGLAASSPSSAGLAWGLVAAVAVIQLAHAVTGVSLGHRAYDLPWLAPELFTRIALRTTLPGGR